MLIASIVISLLLLKRGVLGVIQHHYLLRTPITTPYDTQETMLYIKYLKSVLIYFVGAFFLIKYYKKWTRSYTMVKFFMSSIMIMMSYIIISLIVSGYPILSVVKIVNYFIPLIIIILLVYLVKNIN